MRLIDLGLFPLFFFQAEDGIRDATVDWSSDVCSSDLSEARNAHVTIRVTDNGPGIPRDERERIFEPFYRLGNDRADPGSGLGLAIVKGFVEVNGGRRSEERRVGKEWRCG